MFMSLLSHLLSGWFAFLLPSYKTYKALKYRPISEPELQRWTAYWSVVGAFVAFEYAGEWLLSWFPFYWEIKTAFLLFLSLPQLEGSSYIYNKYFEPYLAKNEAAIDAGIASAHTETLAFLQTRLTAIWDLVWSLVNRTPAPTRPGQESGQAAGAANPIVLAQSLWNTYGSTLVGSFGQSKGNPAPPAAPRSTSSSSTHPIQGYNVEQRIPHTPAEED